MYKLTAFLRSHKDFNQNGTPGHKQIAATNLNNANLNQCHK